jgi:hypothetical protein
VPRPFLNSFLGNKSTIFVPFTIRSSSWFSRKILFVILFHLLPLLQLLHHETNPKPERSANDNPIGWTPQNQFFLGIQDMKHPNFAIHPHHKAHHKQIPKNWNLCCFSKIIWTLLSFFCTCIWCIQLFKCC